MGDVSGVLSCPQCCAYRDRRDGAGTGAAPCSGRAGVVPLAAGMRSL